MNNLNVFILFSTLIYFKLEENKSGNLKIAVGLVALYALYNLLKGSEGWTNGIYSMDPTAGRDNYLRQFEEGEECTGGGQFVAASSPPNFPFDHCVDGTGMICGKLYSSPTIMAMWGTPDGTESASESYNSLPRDTNPRRNSRCETVTCISHAHCQSNESRRYCNSEKGECAECSVDDDCEEEDAVCHKVDDGTKFCVNREQIVQYVGDTRSGGPYDDINDFGVKTCLNNDYYKTYLSSPSISDDLWPWSDNTKDLSKCSNPTKDQVLDPTKDNWSDDCCYSFLGTNDSPSAKIVASIAIGAILALAGIVILFNDMNKENRGLERIGGGCLFFLGASVLILILGGPYLTSPVKVNNVGIDMIEGAVIGGIAGEVLGPAGLIVGPSLGSAGGDVASDTSDSTEDSDS